jgi:hypothetical protein
MQSHRLEKYDVFGDKKVRSFDVQNKMYNAMSLFIRFKQPNTVLIKKLKLNNFS